ncbi:hypothetical protein OKW42_004729 [Paraburkholderia sp. WC7.3d]
MGRFARRDAGAAQPFDVTQLGAVLEHRRRAMCALMRRGLHQVNGALKFL